MDNREKTLAKFSEGSWMQSYIKQYRDKIYNLFSIERRNKQECIELHGKILKLFKVKATPDSVQSFSELISKEFIDFPGFLETLEEWASIISKRSLSEVISETIVSFQSIQEEFPSLSLPELDDLVDILGSFKSEMLINKAMTYNQSEKKALSEVFYYYAKLRISLGNQPTFDELLLNNHSLTLAKFMKFAADFSLLSLVSKEELTSLFKKQALNTRIMNFTAFLRCLNTIAHVSYSGLSLEEARKNLYLKMDLKNYSRKIYGLTRENRYAKPNQLSPKKIQALFDWKKKKTGPIATARNTSQPLKFIRPVIRKGYSDRTRFLHSYFETDRLLPKPLVTFDLIVKLKDKDLPKEINMNKTEDELFNEFYGNDQSNY